MSQDTLKGYENLKPLQNQVLVRIDPLVSVEKKTDAGIILVETNNSRDRANIREATVLATGGGEFLYDGTVRPPHVRKGNRVHLNPADVQPLDWDMGQNSMDMIVGYILDTQILAIVSEG